MSDVTWTEKISLEIRLLSPYKPFCPRTLDLFTVTKTKHKTLRSAPKYGNPLFGRELLNCITVQGLCTFTMRMFLSHSVFLPFPTTFTVAGRRITCVYSVWISWKNPEPSVSFCWLLACYFKIVGLCFLKGWAASYWEHELGGSFWLWKQVVCGQPILWWL